MAEIYGADGDDCFWPILLKNSHSGRTRKLWSPYRRPRGRDSGGHYVAALASVRAREAAWTHVRLGSTLVCSRWWKIASSPISSFSTEEATLRQSTALLRNLQSGRSRCTDIRQRVTSGRPVLSDLPRTASQRLCGAMLRPFHVSRWEGKHYSFGERLSVVLPCCTLVAVIAAACS